MSIETEVSSFSFKIQISAPWVTDGVPRGGRWVIHPQRGRSIPVQLHSPKALCKNIWLIARVKNSRHFPYTIHKNTSGKQEVWFKAKCFCFWKQERRRGERADKVNSQSKGGICPVSLSKQKEIFPSTLGKSPFCVSQQPRGNMYIQVRGGWHSTSQIQLFEET